MGWPVQVVDVTGSTNADLAALARAGDEGPRVLAARAQTHGRGRLGRHWESPDGASLALSAMWRPGVPQPAWTWLPVVVGLAVLDALDALEGLEGLEALDGLDGLGGRARLKWPNDVVVPVEDQAGDQVGEDAVAPGPTDALGATRGLAKLAGILVDLAPGPRGPVVVAGVGVNLRHPGGDVGARATSLEQLLPGRTPGFDATAAALAAALEGRVADWEAAGGEAGRSGVRADYLRVCTTLGRHVRVSTPGGVREGLAVDVDEDGALVLRGDDGEHRVSAGDVEHVR